MQSDAFSNLSKTSTNQETAEKDIQNEARNQESQQQNESTTEESLDNSIPKESTESNKAWKSQKTQSENEKERRIGRTRHFEHRERHCPEEGPVCLVPLPIWYHNVPHTKLAEFKEHQNWVKVSGEFLTFPCGGTQLIHGSLHYIDFLQQAVPNIKWDKRSRVVLDVGCGVASFGGFLFDRDVLTMSFAPKDEHEAQVQFALERGIPAISSCDGVPWHIENGMLLLEPNHVLRPGGCFVGSATPVYQKLPRNPDEIHLLGTCDYQERQIEFHRCCQSIRNLPQMNATANGRRIIHRCAMKMTVQMLSGMHPLRACMHRVPVNLVERGARWPSNWPIRLQKAPYWLNRSQMGIYGKPALLDFAKDYEHWTRVVSKLYMSGLGISWSNVRNVMDMRAVYGGFAAALKDIKVWVMNVVNFDSPDTLPIIYERGANLNLCWQRLIKSSDQAGRIGCQ
ncbi:putative methyltransferase PMT27 [Hibiscus syriacus]|uniref:Methyltransferase n=1 Tax=Hibiscus syriacus TaxID=106335 RepID=A0A6A2ZRU3_HIBSY|nr:putative methyltransferase PMT27 [Hibiscus syriacus]